MPLMTDAAWSIAGVPMDGTIDDNGIKWDAAILGWDTPETRGATEDRPAGDGIWEGPQSFGARTIEATIWGEAQDGDPRTMRDAWEDFIEKLDPNRRVSVQSLHEEPARAVTGSRTGRAPRQFNVNKLTASVAIRCRDPRKYGPMSTVFTGMPASSGLIAPWIPPLVVGGSGGSVTVSNLGKYKTPGIITFRGPIPGPFYAVNTRQNRKIQVNITLTDSDVLTVDLGRGVVLLNGTANRRGSFSPDSSLWLFDKGDTTVLFGGAGFGSGSMSISTAPAWM